MDESIIKMKNELTTVEFVTVVTTVVSPVTEPVRLYTPPIVTRCHSVVTPL